MVTIKLYYMLLLFFILYICFNLYNFFIFISYWYTSSSLISDNICIIVKDTNHAFIHLVTSTLDFN